MYTEQLLSLWCTEELMAAEDDQLKLLYLLSGCTKILPPSYIKLRSYLNLYLSNLADQYNLKLPKIFRSRNKACPFCYSPWNSNTTSFKILPSKKSKFSQGINKNNDETHKAARSKELRNTMVLRCKVCSKNSSFSLIKKKPLKEAPKEEIVGSIRKKKKKKDKSCGLSLNLKITGNSLPEKVVFKKRKRKEILKETAQDKTSQGTHCESQNNCLAPQMKSKSVLVNTKKLVPNPFASQMGGKNIFCRKNDKKLQSLKRAIKEEKCSTKKTLKDFLTLI